jgi:hypothetical protein
MKNNERTTVRQRILEYLQLGYTLTTLDALHLFQCMSLAPRIFELKQQGHAIKKEMVQVPSGKKVAQYSI